MRGPALMRRSALSFGTNLVREVLQSPLYTIAARASLRELACAASMPLVFGIGLTPLLQWLLTPIAALLLFRGIRIPIRRRADGDDSRVR